MNIGLNLSPALAQTQSAAGVQRTDINLPDARANKLTGPNGEGASVHVAISPQAHAALSIDMDSLAAKGYTHVGIDTDGQPGDEITIDVKPGAGVVTVTPDATGKQLEQVVPQNDMVDMLLKAMDDSSAKVKQAEKEPMALPGAGTAANALLSPTTPMNLANPVSPASPKVAVVLSAYNEKAGA